MRQVVALALCTLLVGCATPMPKMVRSNMNFTVVENPNLPGNRLGQARWNKTHCYIELKEYPTCLQHEVRHCLEGDWHSGRPSDKDCFH